MKVKIKYIKDFPSFGDIERFMTRIGIDDDIASKIVDKLYDNEFIKKMHNKICDWWYRDGYEKVDVDIIYDDLWNGDRTLAYILIPFLKEYKIRKEDFGSYPHCEEISSPEEWSAILDEIIWAFENIINDNWQELFTIEEAVMDMDNNDPFDENGFRPIKWKTHGKYDWEGLQAHNDRIQKGCELFGKYFRNFWL